MLKITIVYMKEILQRLTSHLTLDREEAKTVLKKIAAGDYNNSQITAFLTVYMMRNDNRSRTCRIP